MAEDARREGEADSTQEAPASEWADYYDAVGDSPPRATLLEALARFNAEDSASARLAVDLGCGNGRDTVELLRRGWHVLAIDSDAEGLRRLRARITPDQAARLQTSRAPVEAAAWPEVDLVNASYVLPLCSAAAFPRTWQQIVTSLRAGGRLAGQLFGDRDQWATRPMEDTPTIHLTRQQVEALLEPFVIEVLQEEDGAGQTDTGRPKRWHCFHIVARKR